MLQVTTNGARTWILRTMVQGKRRDMGLGGLTTVTLKEAREKAQLYRKIARDNGDPFAVRRSANAPVPTFETAAFAAHRERAPSWKNKKHVEQWINTLKEYAFPIFGDNRIDSIKSEHIIRAISPIWLTKPETARRVLQRIGTVLLWAKGNGHRSDSPSDEIEGVRRALPRQNDNKRHHRSLPYKDLPQFIIHLRACAASDSIKLAFEFLILTATRTKEVLDAKWSEIDLPNKTWRIPAVRMKADRDHSVPLPRRCVEILESARVLSDDEDGYLFPGTILEMPLSNMVFLMTLRRAGMPVTAHGFRSTFRVWCAEKTSFVREVAEAALAHVVKDATEAAYQRSTFFEKRKDLMNAWARFVTGPVSLARK